MFQIKLPLFQKGRILKIEMLEALRDTPLSFIQTTFHNYSDGIIGGFNVAIDKELIIVEPGIVKFGKQILVLDEAVSLPYFATDKVASLKISFSDVEESSDIIIQSAAIELADLTECHENEWELMRFKLKSGAYLRNDYQSFDDLTTEYNTINPIYKRMVLPNQSAPAPEMIRLFCDYLLQYSSQHSLDQTFYMQALQANGILGKKVVEFYVGQRLNEPIIDLSPEELHRKLNQILSVIKQQRFHEKNTIRKNRKLIVD